MSNILITGGTGFIGKALTSLLAEAGYDITILTRSTKEDGKTNQKVAYASWDIEKGSIDREAVLKADHIIHLAGAGVADKRWTKAYKDEILNSRVKSSELLVKTLKETGHKVQSIVSASAIGWYGADKTPGHSFVETEPADPGFLGQTCAAWEGSIRQAEELGVRVTCLRTGIVLEKSGGALKEFMKPMKYGIAPILGTGKQVISWIHLKDLLRVYKFSIENTGMNGSYNATSNIPVTNKELVLETARRLRGRFAIPMHVPAFVLKVMMGESSIEVLKSTTCSNEKIHAAGFRFLYPSINSALDEILAGDR